MDLIPVIENREYDNREYIVFDNQFTVIQFSANLQKYAETPICLGVDVRISFPEMVGLESICQEILLGKQPGFVLESISRNREEKDNLYFNLYIKTVKGFLIILLEDVTELMLLKQSSMQMLNEAEITLNKLQRFEYCTNKIIASMRDVLLITTPGGIIERVNRSATQLFGQKKSDLINQSIDNLILDKDFNHQQIYNFLLSSQKSVSKIEVNFKNQQKQKIEIEFDCFIAPTEIKNFFNCVYIGRDITARKLAEANIRKSLAKEKESLAREKELRQLKEGFISTASHEFRNPLSTILLCVENLQGENNLNEANSELYLQSIQAAALTMNSLLEDLLIISKAESGKQKLKLIPLDLKDFCLQIIQELTSIYADKMISLDYKTEFISVYLDKKTIKYILSNLLSNALKYSPPGATVNLIVSNTLEPAEIIIEVRDRGIGIPKKSQKHLFESFYRAGNVDNIPGTGLGLSIVKKAVSLYRGTITINSKINQGTNVLVRLPTQDNSS